MENYQVGGFTLDDIECEARFNEELRKMAEMQSKGKERELITPFIEDVKKPLRECIANINSQNFGLAKNNVIEVRNLARALAEELGIAYYEHE